MGRRHFKPEQIIHMLREAEDALTRAIVDLASECAAVTVIGASQRYSIIKAGTSITSASSLTAPSSCLVLRLRHGPNPRWPTASYATNCLTEKTFTH